MLNLKLTTDPAWVKDVVERNLEEILTDHAYCEQKAASTAISLIVQFPEFPDLVDKMADLAREEMAHFQMVHKFIKDRNFQLGRERKDFYVHELNGFFRHKGKGREETLADKLLVAAMIEARSCERFKVLSEHMEDKELSEFYFNLMKSEARHYTMFLKLARTLAPGIDVDSKWEAFLEFEGEVISRYGKQEYIHG